MRTPKKYAGHFTGPYRLFFFTGEKHHGSRENGGI
jgi:hypothetical protein